MEQSIPGKKSRVNALAYRNVILALMEGPHTYVELAELSGLADRTVRNMLLPFRQRPRVVRIGAWNEDNRGRAIIPAFEWGEAADERRRPMTTAARKTRQRERAKMLRMIQATAGVRVNDSP